MIRQSPISTVSPPTRSNTSAEEEFEFRLPRFLLLLLKAELCDFKRFKIWRITARMVSRAGLQVYFCLSTLSSGFCPIRSGFRIPWLDFEKSVTLCLASLVIRGPNYPASSASHGTLQPGTQRMQPRQTLLLLAQSPDTHPAPHSIPARHNCQPAIEIDHLHLTICHNPPAIHPPPVSTAPINQCIHRSRAFQIHALP